MSMKFLKIFKRSAKRSAKFKNFIVLQIFLIFKRSAKRSANWKLEQNIFKKGGFKWINILIF